MKILNADELADMVLVLEAINHRKTLPKLGAIRLSLIEISGIDTPQILGYLVDIGDGFGYGFTQEKPTAEV